MSNKEERYTLMRMHHLENNEKLKSVAESFSANYIDIKHKSVATLDLWRFKMRALMRILALYRVHKIAKAAYKTGATSDEAISRMYDVEYGNVNRSNYMYLNTLLSVRGFELVTGYARDEIRKLKIIDVGAGSNEFLRFCHTKLGAPKDRLYGSDISHASKDIIEKDGFHGYVGRIEDLSLPDNNFDAVFLSYFIDFDTDQRTTFETAIKITRPGGKIILEGLFPSKPNGLLEADRMKNIFITKGEDAAEDISLVCNAFLDLGENQDKKIVIEKIVRSWRYVYSRYGLNKLPSYFIVLKTSE